MEKSSLPTGIQRGPAQETTVAQSPQMKQTQNVQPLRTPTIALDRTAKNDRNQLRNPTSESQNTQNKPMPVFVRTLQVKYCLVVKFKMQFSLPLTFLNLAFKSLR